VIISQAIGFSYSDILKMDTIDFKDFLDESIHILKNKNNI